MYKRILIATDLSESADVAVQAGFKIAREERAEVHLCTALGAPREPMTLGVRMRAEDLEAQIQEARRSLHSKAATTNGCAKVEHQVHVFKHLPGDEIPRAARELGCDLIVICSRGRSGPRRFVLGSVAERILGNASVPVLVVPARS